MSVYADPRVRGKGARARRRDQRRAEAAERLRGPLRPDLRPGPVGLAHRVPDAVVPAWARRVPDELPLLVFPAPVPVAVLLHELEVG